MTQQLATPEPLYVRLGDAFVILAATLLSLASGAWLIAQFGLELSFAILAALGTYCTLLLLHLLVRRLLHTGEERDDNELAEGDGDAHWQTGPAAFESALARHADDADRLPVPDDAPMSRPRPAAWPEPLPMPPAAESEAPFKFRPSRIPYFEGGEGTEPTLPGPTAADQGKTEDRVPPPEINVEVIQNLIKKLADELNDPAAGASAADGGPVTEPPGEPEAMIGRSVAALDAAVRGMRTPPAGPGAAVASATRGDVPDWWPTALAGSDAGGPPALDQRLTRIAEAVAAERFEVLIEPIHALAEGRPRHYEVSMRLLTADGAVLEQADYMRTAQSSDLLAHIDAARMLRAARVARRLAERGRQGSVLSAMAGDSITDNGFLDAVAQETGNDGHIRLVLSFTQSDARNFTPAHAEALGTMAASGFGFALEDVTDLEMDFAKLKAIGFEFVKLDAKVFLDGMQAPGGCVPAADICRYLSEFGLGLIVANIEDDWLLAKVMGFGVLLGKGTMFGGPRRVPEVVAGPGTAAA